MEVDLDPTLSRDDNEPFDELLKFDADHDQHHAKLYTHLVTCRRRDSWYDLKSDEVVSQTEFKWQLEHGSNHSTRVIVEYSKNPDYKIIARTEGVLDDFKSNLGLKLLRYAADLRQVAQSTSMQLDLSRDERVGELFDLAEVFDQIDPWLIEALLIADVKLNEYCSKREFWDTLLFKMGFKKRKMIAHVRSFYLEMRKRALNDLELPVVIEEHAHFDVPVSALRGAAISIAEVHHLLDGDRVILMSWDEKKQMDLRVNHTEKGYTLS